MNMRTIKWLCFLSLLTIPLATGCMVGPGDNGYVGQKNDPVVFSGFVTSSGQLVEIEARVPGTNTWEKIGQARSDQAFYKFEMTWYMWVTDEIVVPSRYWYNVNTRQQPIYHCEIRAVNSNGPLYAFKWGFYNWFDDYDDLVQMWNEKGSPTVTTTRLSAN